MPDLSVIVPIYKTPIDALERCFSSLASVKGPEFEVLMVDDGSGGEVGQFCQEYSIKHPEFQYFYKENGGVSSARNYGLDRATGRYIMFVDADDQVLGEPITQKLLDQDADLVILDMQLWENGNQSTWPSLSEAAGPVSKDIILRQLLSGKSLNSPCVKLFRRELIQVDKLRFRTDFITGEDWLFVTEFSEKAQSFYYEPRCCYRYYRDDATSSSRLARFPDVMLDNCIAMHEKRMQVIGGGQWDAGVAARLRCAGGVMMTEDLFNSAAELLLMKLLTPERRERIVTAVAKTELAAAPAKTQLKAFTLLRFPAALWLLAKLRGLYLKLKY